MLGGKLTVIIGYWLYASELVFLSVIVFKGNNLAGETTKRILWWREEKKGRFPCIRHLLVLIVFPVFYQRIKLSLSNKFSVFIYKYE